jgi:uncharacterized damage-inducible protein DinB
MTFPFSLDDLLAYSDWDRARWRDWFLEKGPGALSVGLGPNADGRFNTIGELIRHIFSAEKRYVERVLKVPLSDTSVVPAGDVEALFHLGQESRRALRELLATTPNTEWDTPREMQVGKQVLNVTARAMIIQTITHEVRHWAQIATLLRLAGHATGSHDYIASHLARRPEPPAVQS